MPTFQEIVDLGRIPLNDTDKVRYSDETLMLFANQGMLALAKRRPDLFLGQFDSLPDGTLTLTDSLSIEAGYAQLLADYITARAEMTDDEHVNSGRAAMFVQLFGSEAAI